MEGRSPLIKGATFQQLQIGLNQALHVREERLSTRHDACRLLYVSDIHLRNGRSDTLCRQVLDAVTRCNPDVVLLGGDLVDRPSELSKLSDLVGRPPRSRTGPCDWRQPRPPGRHGPRP